VAKTMAKTRKLLSKRKREEEEKRKSMKMSAKI